MSISAMKQGSYIRAGGKDKLQGWNRLGYHKDVEEAIRRTAQWGCGVLTSGGQPPKAPPRPIRPGTSREKPKANETEVRNPRVDTIICNPCLSVFIFLEARG